MCQEKAWEFNAKVIVKVEASFNVANQRVAFFSVRIVMNLICCAIHASLYMHRARLPRLPVIVSWIKAIVYSLFQMTVVLSVKQQLQTIFLKWSSSRPNAA